MECGKVQASDKREDGPMRPLSRSLRRERRTLHKVRSSISGPGGGTEGRWWFICGYLRGERICRTARADGGADFAAAPESRAVDLGWRLGEIGAAVRSGGATN